MCLVALINEYPPSILSVTCYSLLLLESIWWLGKALFTNNSDEEDEVRAVFPKFLFLLVSLMIAYFLMQVIIPEGFCSPSFAWREHFLILFAYTVIAAVAMFVIYGLKESKGRFFQVSTIFVLVNLLYYLISGFSHVTDSAFSYYVIAYFVGGNIPYAGISLSEANKKPA